MEEIPALSNGTEVDPISYIIKTAGSPVHCNDIAPSRYKVGGKWYYSYLELRECHDPAMLPVAEVRMESVEMNEHQTGQEYLHQEAIRHVLFKGRIPLRTGLCFSFGFNLQTAEIQTAIDSAIGLKTRRNWIQNCEPENCKALST
jgi:hypothetical protein